MKKNTWKKVIASALAAAVAVTGIPASESMAAENNWKMPWFWEIPETTTGGAVSARPETSRRPQSATPGAVTSEPKATRAPHVTGAPEETRVPKATRAPHASCTPQVATNGAVTEKPAKTKRPAETRCPGNVKPVSHGGIGGKYPEFTVVTGGACIADEDYAAFLDWISILFGVENADEIYNDWNEFLGQDDFWNTIDWSDDFWKEIDKEQRPVTGGAIVTDPKKEDTKPEKKHTETVTPSGIEGEVADSKKEDTKPEKKHTETATPSAIEGEVTDSTENVAPEKDKKEGTKKPGKKKAKIKVPTSKKRMKKGKQYKISYSVVSGSGKVTFKSSNRKVATVTSKGVVKAKKKGTAVITVKIANGNTKKVKITVK